MGSADEGFDLLAARYLRKQLRTLTEQLDGVRQAEDIECVHQARVASRRLRAAMRMFRECLPGGKLRKWRKGIRRLTRRLGPARDRDVQMAFVERYLADLQDEAARAGVQRLGVRLRQQREALQSSVVKAINRLAASGILDSMDETTKAMESRLEAREVTVRTPFVFLRSERLILRRLEAVLGFQDCLANPADKARHHQMRIATKRMRYTMEICRSVYAGQIDEAIRAAKKIQTLLGDLHDCDVWMEQLPAFEQEERERTSEYFGDAAAFAQIAPGIEHLSRSQQRRRDELFAELTACWQRLGEQGLWDQLAATLLSQVRQSVQTAEKPAPPAEQVAPPPDAADQAPEPQAPEPAPEPVAPEPAPEPEAAEPAPEPPDPAAQTHPPAPCDEPPVAGEPPGEPKPPPPPPPPVEPGGQPG